MSAIKLRLLLVDDDPFLTTSLTRQLNQRGFQNVHIARNGEQCMNQLGENDIVILDHWLMEENGMDLLKQIKSDYPDLPVIFLSGNEFIAFTIKSLKFGAFDCIEKSKLTIDNLIEVIQRIVYPT